MGRSVTWIWFGGVQKLLISENSFELELSEPVSGAGHLSEDALHPKSRLTGAVRSLREILFRHNVRVSQSFRVE